MKTHLGLLFLVIVCLIGVGSTLIANSIVTKHIIREAQESVKEDLNTARYVGMLYVGMLESKYAAIKERIIFLFLLFSMSGMLLALTVSFLLARKMLQK